MSFNNNSRKIRGVSTVTVALARIEQEGRALLRDVAGRSPAKTLARAIGKTPRHIYNLRDGECQTGWLTFIALAQQAPELRQAVARWLGLAPGPESAALRAEIEAVLARHPEEGMRE